MKKFLFWATVVGASLTGCVNDNGSALNAEDNPQAITFEVASYKASSRADEGATTNDYKPFDTGLIFGTFAWEANGHGATHVPFMENTQIAYVGGVWIGIDKPYFWPSEKENHIDFVSYFPYSSTGTDSWVPQITENVVGKDDYNKLIYNNYKVDGQDLMFSDKAHLQTSNHVTYFTSGVPTLFRHALAKLNFMVAAKYLESKDGDQTTYWQVKVHSIKIGGIRDEGTVTMTTTSPTTGASALTTQWSIVKTDSEQPDVWNVSGSVAEPKTWSREGGHPLLAVDESQPNSNYEIFGAGTGRAVDYMIMPQKIEQNQQYINIVYTIASRAEIGGEWKNEEEFDKTFTFDELNKKGASILNWEMGKNITYKILIDPKGDLINFDPAEVDWVPVNGGTLDM